MQHHLGQGWTWYEYMKLFSAFNIFNLLENMSIYQQVTTKIFIYYIHTYTYNIEQQAPEQHKAPPSVASFESWPYNPWCFAMVTSHGLMEPEPNMDATRIQVPKKQFLPTWKHQGPIAALLHWNTKTHPKLQNQPIIFHKLFHHGCESKKNIHGRKP